MKNLKKILSLVLALAMALSLMTVAFAKDTGDFADGDDVTYAEAVDVMATAGIFNGTGDGTNFDPNGTLTREQAAKIITYMLIGQTQADKLVATIAPFADVSADRWSAGAIAYCASEGIMNGTGNGKFNPTGELTGLQFAKMLLVALGYDADIEEMTGAAWGLATSKLAYDINLDDGLAEDVNLTSTLTREQAAQMAFTTMKTPMVQYPDKGSTISVNGAVVQFGARQAEYRTSTVDKGQTISTARLTNNGGYLVEFAERHCTDLRLRKGSDDFGRPADIWYWKSEKIGTYEDEADLTYTKKVSMGTIYKDLGINDNIALDSLTYYENGVAPYAMTPYAVRRGDDTNKIGNNGVLTQVYYDEDTHTAIITLINTYTGEISRTVAASGNRDAYIVIAVEGVAAPSGVGGSVNFETNDSVADDTRVLYTYSQSANEVIDVYVAESTAGVVTRTENKNTDGVDGQAMTIDGTRYAASAMIAGEPIGEVTVKNDYTIYLDLYGYAIYVEETEVGIGNYALLIDTANSSTFIGNRARLLLTDGTIKNVTTDKNYNAGTDAIKAYSIVTFRVDDDDVYSLRQVETAQSFMNADRNPDPITGGTLNDNNYADAFSMTNDKAGITVDAAANSYASTDNVASTTFNANSATVFVVADNGQDGSDDDFTAYTGIKNAPTISNVTADSKAGGVAAYWFCKGTNSKMITVMFIFPGTNVTVEDGNSKMVYVSKESVSNLYHDADGDYFVYNAIVGDEIKTDVKVDGAVKLDGTALPTTKVGGADQDYASQSAATKGQLSGPFKSSSSDKYGVITNLKRYDAYTVGNSEELLVGTGVDKRNKEYTLILNTHPTAADHGTSNVTITAADNCKYYYVDKDGVITTSSYNSVAIDTNDNVYAIVKDYLVQTLIIEEVENPADTYSVNFTDGTSLASLNGKLSNTLSTINDIAKDGSAIFTLNPKSGITIEDVQVNGGTLSKSGNTYTVSGITKNITVTVTTSGAVVGYNGDIVFNTSNKTQVTAEWTGAAKPTEAELASALIDELVRQGYDKSTASITKLDNNDVSVKIKKTINGVAGPEDIYKIDPSGGDLVEVVAPANQAALTTAAAGSKKIKLTFDGSLSTAPNVDIVVESGAKLTLDTGVTSLTKNITGAGSVEVKDNIATGGEKIAVTGGITVADAKTLTLGATAVTCDITGAGKVSTAAAITNGDKIKVAGGLTLAASSSIDKIGNIDVTVTGNTSISGVAAPKTLTHSGGKITVAATGDLTLPAALTVHADGMEINGKVTAGGNLTISGTNVSVGATGVLDLNSKELVGSATAKLGVTANAQIKNVTGTKFYALDGSAVSADITVPSTGVSTYNWGNTYGSGSEVGWTATA